MVRASSITQHPERERIEAAIVEGVPAVRISAKYDVSQSAISRHKKLRMSAVLAEMLTEEPGVTDALTRLRALADSTRRSRQLEDATGSPGSRAKAQSNELAVLSQLIGRLGLRDLSDLDYAKSVQQMSNAITRFLRTHPQYLNDITRELLAQDEQDWHEWVAGLSDHIRKATA